MDRKQIRRNIRNKRKQLTDSQRNLAAEDVAKQIVKTDVFKTSQRIACYIAKGAELSVQPIIDAIWQQNKHCYLPIMRHDKPGFLHFVEYLPNDKLESGNFGILEPIFDENKLIVPQDLDLVIVPLLAFDFVGNRIGSGGGYYDRTFAFLNDEKAKQKPLLFGVAYACQEVEKIKPQAWDVQLHMVVVPDPAFTLTI